MFSMKRLVAAVILTTTLTMADIICQDMGDVTWCQDRDTGQETWIYR